VETPQPPRPQRPELTRPASTPRSLQLTLVLYLLSAVLIAVQRTVLSRENNFWIFRTASEHLRSGADLYAAYPGLHADFFKYSPTFAFFFAPFAALPPVVGYALWACTCAFAVWAGVRALLPERAAVLALALAWIGVVGDLQRAQSNALIAGLMVLAWVAFERQRVGAAAAAVATGAFIKIFPLAAGLGALLHRRWWRFAPALTVAMIVGAVLPVLVAGDTLGAQYRSWYAIETADTQPEARYGIGGADLYAGVMGQFRVWLGVDWPHWPIQLAGLVILVLPLALQWRRRSERVFRLVLLCSVLMFCVLFNHQAESPSYVIAMLGVCIWFAVSERTTWRTVTLVVCIAIVQLGSTDLMPRSWYHGWYVPFLMKTIPLIPVWVVLQLELLGVIPNRGASEIREADQGDTVPPESLANAQ